MTTDDSGETRLSQRVVLAVTGASGTVYADRLIDVLLQANRHVHLIESDASRLVLPRELKRDTLADRPVPPASLGSITVHPCDDFSAAVASGSFRTDAMVVCPCSSNTLGAIAAGSGTNLIHRAADVHLKERRPLVLVPRETPLSLIHIENMRRATLAGAVILPAMPAFYHGVESVDDLIAFVVARICDQIGIPHSLITRWE